MRAGRLIERMRAGESVALVTDAGMPSVSDPGYALVVAAIAAGLPVVPVPGVSAVPTALSAAGLPTDSFLFAGFPPRRVSRRRRFLADLSAEDRTLVFFESPRRILTLLADMRQVLGDRRVVLAREMTKRHEEFLRGTLSHVLQVLGERQTVRGELTLLVAPDREGQEPDEAVLDREIAARLGEGVSVSETSRQVSRLCGVSRNRVYRRALAVKTDEDGEAGETSVD
jgi:16S rRNA (cytidine1402-2'-O)-methyltransferase